MNKFRAFHMGDKITVEANTTLEAKERARGILKARKLDDITVVLVERNGKKIKYT